MLSRWPIRNKLLIGIGLLVAMLATLSASGFLGMYSYRALVKSLSGRASELPLASDLAKRISDMRVAVSESQRLSETSLLLSSDSAYSTELAREQFRSNLSIVRYTFILYSQQLEENMLDSTSLNDDCEEELAIIHKIAESLNRIQELDQNASGLLMTEDVRLQALSLELDQLQALSAELPSPLHDRLQHFAGEVRTQYRTWIVITWATTLLAVIMMSVFIHLFYKWIFRPLRVLIKGSRRVASGEFNYRISINSHDEMSELAEAMNNMTIRFQNIRDDLDRQVQIRTRQVVRSEQLASVGFLAAGVSHEINNPLASIAMCAESLESRLQDITASADDLKLLQRYLRMIQDEAFRCKGITEKLLDFSRTGEVQRQTTDLRELIEGVIDMVRTLGRYNDKHIEFAPSEPALVCINSQEIKQVILNLITNALDSVDKDGKLLIEIRSTQDHVELVFTDNGCGMSEEVQQNLFEPFFTRKRGAQGTGLGLSIVYRIVAEHEGQIEASSEGPGKGSQFCVTLPKPKLEKEPSHQYQAA